MAKLVVKHSTAQWHELVKEAEGVNGIRLDEELESYLVFLLMRYTEHTELAARALALEYLESAQLSGNERNARMRDVGDQCLLLSGLFPRRAQRRRVSISYYVDLGRGAYQTAADATQAAMAVMFNNLSRSFVSMMDTLQAIRSLNSETSLLEPIQAYELWNDTNSLNARRILEKMSHSNLIRTRGQRRH